MQLDHPVPGYPLNIVASWEPTQAGSGEPSPDNIRPIKGRERVTITRQEDNRVITLALPETIYGGEVDVSTGEGKEAWTWITLDGTEQWRANNQSAKTSVFITTFSKFALPFDGTSKNMEIFSSHFKKATRLYLDGALPGTLWYSDDGTQIRIAWNPGDDPAATVEDFIGFLSAQYAAGTPVQIAYKLAAPSPFTATGGATIPALEGINTILTDADSVTVKARADPNHVITELQDAIASITSTKEG